MATKKITAYSIEGKKLDEIEYSYFGDTISNATINQVIRVYENNKHQGTKSTKTRGDVAHPDKKPWKQKGTGRARHGSKNSPIWVGGGVTFGPQPNQRRLSVPDKLKKKAMRFLLDSEINNDNFIVLNSEKGLSKTKQAVDFMKSTGLISKKTTLIVLDKDETVATPFRNVKNITIRRHNLVCPLDLYGNRKYVITADALDALIKRLK